MALLALAGLLALVAALWRVAWPGYLVAALLAAATLLAATRGFFTAWQPVDGDYGYLICGITLGLALLGQALRRIHPRYAHPYELAGFALLTLAPIPTTGSAQHAALTWAGMALLNGSAWLTVGGRPAGAGLLLLAATWAQALLGLWSARRTTNDERPFDAAQGRRTTNDYLLNLQPGYVVAVLSGLGALVLASGAFDILAIVAFGLTALLALLATVHRIELIAWGALALLALGFGSLHAFLDITPLWSLAWGLAEALALCLIGWAIELTEDERRKTKGEGGDDGFVLRPPSSVLGLWYRPLWIGPLLAGTALVGTLLLIAPSSNILPPLTFALA